MASNNRRQAATIAVARGSRLGLAASAGSATMMGRSAPSPWRSASASASPANAPPPMTMLRCTDILDLLLTLLLLEYSWAKQVDETRVLLPSSRHSVARDCRKAEISRSLPPDSRIGVEFFVRRESADPLASSEEMTRKSRALQCPK